MLRHHAGNEVQARAHFMKGQARPLKGLLPFMFGPNSAAPGPPAVAAGAAFCSAGTARKMGCSVAMGKSDSSTVASCDCPSSRPCTTNLASSARRHIPAVMQSSLTSGVQSADQLMSS